MKRFWVLALVGLLLSGAQTGWGAVRSGAGTLSVGAGGYFFESQQDLEDAAVYSLSLGYNFTEHWTGEATGSYFHTNPEHLSDFDIEGWSGRFDLIYNFTPGNAFVPYLAVGVGGLILDPESGETDEDGFADWGLGFKYFFNDTVALRVDGRHFVTVENENFDGTEYQNFSATGGLQFQFGGGGEEPAVALDLDGDGVPDSLDRCLDSPAGARVDAFGCPADSDGDGIIDDLDQCPGTAPDTEVDSRGCPRPASAPAPVDSDGDGVLDDADRCPDTPAGTVVDRLGCPADSDGDGVLDGADRCPGTPAGAAVDAAGCPEREKESLSLQIEFASGRSALDSAARAELQKAVAFVKAHPGSRIVVEGHTDSVGSATYNQRLSQQRAESVRGFLLDRTNLAAGQIVARGYGETRPVADNATPEGRLQNRRVVIRVEE